MVYDQKHLFTHPQVSGFMEVTLLHTEGLQVTWDLLISAELSSRLETRFKSALRGSCWGPGLRNSSYGA